MRARPASLSLSILLPSWSAPRPPTPRRATFPLLETTSSSSIADLDKTPPVPAFSYWLPDTPSPFSPSSPVNPFLIAPQPQSLFYRASPLIPASPLSMFDVAMSPGYMVSPMGSTCAVDVGFSRVSPSFLHSRTVTPSPQRTFFFPLTPRFMVPPTPACPRAVEVKVWQEVRSDGGRNGSVQHALEEAMVRKASMASVLSMGHERMRMRSSFYQWLAVRRWEGMEGKKDRGWKLWRKRLTGGAKKKGVKLLKVVVNESEYQATSWPETNCPFVLANRDATEAEGRQFDSTAHLSGLDHGFGGSDGRMC
ncbi:hypothetical protein DE146DRAFT_631362 [Phaeosphaeria sp. MPI-PUGE-AT-0046c]|nr:hypothetical protein DE146DRAFT_631362 [Phaeosphaeria sp. MPI-PUGE-AT-0046c]